MEIPKHWRQQSSRVGFVGEKKEFKDTKMATYKYPGGEIPLVGGYHEIRERFEKKGFSFEATNEILFRLWGGIPAESAISLAEVAESFHQFVGSEVGK